MVRKQLFMMESSYNNGRMRAEFLSKIDNIAFRQYSRLNDYTFLFFRKSPPLRKSISFCLFNLVLYLKTIVFQ